MSTPEKCRYIHVTRFHDRRIRITFGNIRMGVFRECFVGDITRAYLKDVSNRHFDVVSPQRPWKSYRYSLKDIRGIALAVVDGVSKDAVIDTKSGDKYVTE